jgi:hypothetical protein
VSERFFIKNIAILIFLIQAAGYSDINYSVVSVLGKPEVRAKGTLKSYLIAHESILTEGDRVKLKNGDDLTLEDSKGNIINLIGPVYYRLPFKTGSSGNIEEISLFDGKIDFRVMRVNADISFVVRSPTAIAGVRSVPGSMDESGNFIPLMNMQNRRNKREQ